MTKPQPFPQGVAECAAKELGCLPSDLIYLWRWWSNPVYQDGSQDCIYEFDFNNMVQGVIQYYNGDISLYGFPKTNKEGY